jgi:hypothetical protein
MRRWRLTPSTRTGQLIVLTALAVLLYVGAAVGLAAIPGYSSMRHTLAGVRWPWVLASVGGVLAALAGYLLAWRGLASGGVDGVSLSRRQRVAVVLAGFGGFIGRGGSAIDRYALLQLVRLHAVVVRGAARSSLHRRSCGNTEPGTRRPVQYRAR